MGEEGPYEHGLRIAGRVVDPGDAPPQRVHPAQRLLHEILGEMSVPAGQQAGRPEELSRAPGGELPELLGAAGPGGSLGPPEPPDPFLAVRNVRTI
ncbi:hypothetical protein GCM10010388_44610 [Streptomyces mauvecolor]